MERWERLAAQQAGVVARRQLNGVGIDADRVRNEIAARRWVARTPTVISTTTGELTWRQRVWLGVLHAGGDALVGGLSALEWHGLRNWHRDDVTILVDDELSFDPVPGVRFFRTRRPLPVFRAPGSVIPLCRVEPAALLMAGYDRSARTAQGVLAAVVQQRLTTPDALLRELRAMTPLRRARLFRRTLIDIGGGAESLAELDLGRLCRRAGLPPPRRQAKRRDATGRVRFTDCEWALRDGRTLILEIDGAFHMEVEHWEDDLARQRHLSGQGRIVIRCTARELREHPETVLSDLQRHGLCA
ncbi:DUF559 domain-containing protein [Marmoricola sp. RAF53]|uniref:DUF559 domain-containing protein n=1 Tax=Marmoricola sp. RAF53 TaxID=3233059 RepID=UPI003F9D437B